MSSSYFKRITAVALSAVALFSSVSAQTSVEDQKKEINKIKKSSSYIYAEATLADKQAAIDLAKDILYQNVNEWVSKQKKFAGSNSVVTVNTNYAVDDMTLPRGNMYRAFMYVKKSDIIPASNVTVTETPEMQVAADGKPSSKVEVIAGDTEASAVVSELLKAENTGQLSAVLKQLKQQGKVSDYNKLSALSQPEGYFMVIFTREGNIEAVLSDGADRVNMKTGQADKIANYKGCGAIGVKINK
ncbi:MAG: hypothetical protein J6K19_04315 [Prevotella sp.]|nr:hypothetical protein [Prevotella sp.]